MPVLRAAAAYGRQLKILGTQNHKCHSMKSNNCYHTSVGLITEADFNSVMEKELSKPSQNRRNSLLEHALHQLKTGDMESKLKNLEMLQKFNDSCLVAGLITKEEVIKENKLLKPKNLLSKEFEIHHLQTDYITSPEESEKTGCLPCRFRKNIQVTKKSKE